MHLHLDNVGAVPKSIYSNRYRKFLELFVETRMASGMSQRALAAKLKVPYATIANIETGQRRVDLAEFIELALLLGINPEPQTTAA